jgi:CBS-domain-containing membrane protein
MTTGMEAYLTGIVAMSLMQMETLTMKVIPTTDDQGRVNGIITLRDNDDNVRFTIAITENRQPMGRPGRIDLGDDPDGDNS